MWLGYWVIEIGLFATFYEFKRLPFDGKEKTTLEYWDYHEQLP